MKTICAILQAVSGGFSICQVVFGYIQPELFFDWIFGVVCAGCLARTDTDESWFTNGNWTLGVPPTMPKARWSTTVA